MVAMRAVLWLLCTLSMALATRRAARSQPNIVVVMTDDQDSELGQFSHHCALYSRGDNCQFSLKHEWTAPTHLLPSLID